MSSSARNPTLPTRRLGDSELEVSVVGLGCNNFGRRLGIEGTTAVVEAALDEGITFFDTADVYGEVGANVGALRWEPSADDLRELDRIAPPRK
jgi:aryl-alcohol dehydrogenase-like predicted oxidoreductase